MLSEWIKQGGAVEAGRAVYDLIPTVFACSGYDLEVSCSFPQQLWFWLVVNGENQVQTLNIPNISEVFQNFELLELWEEVFWGSG